MTKLLKFWGTRGSCSVSGPQYSRFGGNSSCLEIRYGETLIIIDAGTGIRPLGLTLRNEKKIDLFLSHYHWDHLVGFPFFEPIYRKDVKITIWAPRANGRSCRDLFDQLLAKEFFPVHLDEIQATLEFRIIEEKTPVHVGPLTLDFHATHHPGLTYCFKIKTPHQTIGYVSDNEILPESQKSLIDFHRGSDLFIHEAQYNPEEYTRKKGWGHSCISKAIHFVSEVHPGKWLVSHHDPEHSDEDLLAMEAIAKKSNLPCPAEWLRDGQIINLH
jgi:phosphoribosyl 1,2-cyclic phosphodiesterase